MHDVKRTELLSNASTWGRIGLLSFGGPAAQIAMMHRIIVDEKAWLNERQFLRALNFCMLLPGPEAMQLATYAGWRMHGVAGGLMAGLLFVVPGAIIVLALAGAYATYGQIPWVQALFLGVKAAVIVVVLEALIKVSKRALLRSLDYIIAGSAFLAMFVFSVPFALVVMTAAIVGFVHFDLLDEENAEPLIAGVTFLQTLKTIIIWLAIWACPFILLWLIGAEQILLEIGLFFSKLAVVTFGGAYAVLAYMAQDVVAIKGWLMADEMVDGLGLAETTPGPLILVTEFVGFLAAERVGGFWMGLAGAIVTLWVTFVPCFLWIFAGAPYIEWLSSMPRLASALAAITAAVVGVILNLALWFAINVFFADIVLEPFALGQMVFPVLDSLDWRPVILAIFSGILLFGIRLSLPMVLLLAALSGLILSLAFA